MQLEAQQNLHATPLILWRRRVAETRCALLPTYTNRPNPRVVGDVVVASVFSPGRIVALERATGDLRWELELPYYGTSNVHFAEGRLFGGSSQALWAIEPETGKKLWEFAPDRPYQERIYSSPVVSNGRLFVGDREARLHCLSIEDGRPLWTVRASRISGDQLNATGYACEDRIVVATTYGHVSAVEMESGRVIWSQRLTRAAVDELKLFQGAVLVKQLQSIHACDPQSGKLIDQWHWPEEELGAWELAGDLLLTVRTRDHRLRDDPPGPRPRRTGSYLSAYRGHEEVWRLPYPLYSQVHLRWVEQHGCLYEATSVGLGMVDIAVGERRLAFNRFRKPGFGVWHHQTGLPDSHESTLYVLTEKGWLCAVRHPLLWQSLRQRRPRTLRTHNAFRWRRR